MSPADAARLQDAFRRESTSLLRYARAAAPYAAGADKKLRTDLFCAGDEAGAAIDALGAVLESHRVTVPPPGAFPAAFTDLNCVAVRYVIPKVVADRAAAAAGLEADLAALTDSPARAALQPLLDLARCHRDSLASGM